MPRQVRIQYPGAMYHVMSGGNRRQDIYLDDVDRQDFLKTLAEALKGSSPYTRPDPPPGVLEAGCLRRAWARFETRVSRLKEAFGQLIPSVISGAAQLWEQMRLAKETLAAILGFLAQSRNLSLLGDYRCLRLPP